MAICLQPGCWKVVARGRCATCALKQERYRGSAAQRGYDRSWLAFRPQFIAMLVAANVLPVCGAALPAGPTQRDSQCLDAGLFTFTSKDGSSLHLDHEPALEDWERHDPALVCDPQRIVLKCAECHNRKTAKEMQSKRGGGDQSV